MTHPHRHTSPAGRPRRSSFTSRATGRRLLAGAAACGLLLLGSGPLAAQELNPSIYVLVDTSGSMLMTPDGSSNTYGDGSAEHPGVSGLTSRLYMAKEALRTVINAYGEVRWGMARFQQSSGHNYLCSCSDEIPNNTSGCGGYGGLWDPQDECRLCDVMNPYPDYDEPGTHDRVCINYAGGLFVSTDGNFTPCLDPFADLSNPAAADILDGADILVPLGAGNQSEILGWIDHSESDPGEAGYSSSLSPEQQPDPELRAMGGTPIGGSLADLYDQLSTTDLGNDPLRGCRPYSIIVLTDGAESCDSDPVTWATQLLQVPDLQRGCGTGCPPGSTCNGTHCVYEVRTYVIAFAVAPNEFINCNDIAVAGNTGGAIPADNDAELVAAMAQIIADSIRTELCNGVDDDCDGAIDEDYPDVGDPCDNGALGQCYCAGTKQCAAGGQGTECAYHTATAANPCGEPAFGYGAESSFGCDGLDNDCDGLVDEGLICSDPPPEMCNGVDDDGDPNTPDGADDPAVGQPCGTSIGQCSPGTTVCQNGSVVCQGGQGPVAETCNGYDDNCDGVVDGLTRGCYTPGSGNGCTYDSQTDTWSCQGQCSAGVQVCQALSSPDPTNDWGACLGETGPTTEICDGVDNDCDGLVDENLTEECYPPGSGPDTGCQESGGVWTCEGLCQTGTRTCANGVWSQCTGHVTPALEVCDALDNDCNGLVDDDIPGLGQPCSNALGRCTPGTLECINGQETCTGGDGPFPGRCNGMDDDCDGAIDETNELDEDPDNGAVCGTDVGECETGNNVCVGGAWVCMGEVGPVTEACDGLDNDCNGLIDDEAVCPPDWYCVAAACRRECDPNEEFPCPSGLQCQEADVDGQMRWLCLPPSGICGGTTCPEGWVCVDDECVDPCADVTCEDWETCRAGICMDESCTGLGGSCPTGEICNPVTHACEPDPCALCGPEEACVDGLCEADPCLALECDPVWEYCRRDCDGGDCSASCETLCACQQGERCDADGQCEPDPCAGACVGGEVCDGGTCVADPCLDVSCPPYEVCVEGTCRPDPCDAVQCPPHATCVVHETGDGTAVVGNCEPAPGHWVPHGDGEELTILGGGAAGCNTSGTAGPSGPTPAGWLLVLAGLLGLALRRRRLTALRSQQLFRRLARRLSRTTPMTAVGMGLTLGLAANSCELSTYQTGSGGHWEHLDGGTDGWVPSDATTDASTDACVPTEEVCDGRDNDCDGVVDNGFNLAADPENCGGCGIVCDFDHAIGDCEDPDDDGLGTCVMTCLPGHVDLNNDDSDGCEYACQETGGGTEICDGLDNDCNGTVDDGFDLQNDPENCGACGFVCVFFNGQGDCVNGSCELSGCDAGYVDQDQNPNNGCECMITDPNDVCDGVDSDCDGQIDEDAPVGDDCYTHPTGCTETSPGSGVWTCEGECTTGNMGCVGGVTQCTNQQGPAGEICNGLDDDCNGTVDDGFDLQNDLANCGACGNSCFTSAPADSYATDCSGGSCQFACLPGFHDLDGDLHSAGSNGCEYACSQTAPAGTEYCDGVDNDCDGNTDEAGDLVSPPAGLCKEQAGTLCSGVSTQCTTGVLGTTWYCQYPSGVETDPANPNQVLANELICDGVDGNCDGNTDESFSPLPGTACDDGLLGVCRGTGAYQCNAAGDDVECVITNPGASPGQEVCDAVDNDCDGLVDEPLTNPGTNPSYVQDDVVTVTVGGETVRVFRYEASRPDATSADEGSGSERRACSRSGVLPWSRVTYEQARLACQRAGMQLCDAAAWFEACDGQSGTWAYPYHPSNYNANACNGADAGAGFSEPTGSRTSCDSDGYGIYDLSGNLREWTSAVVDYTAGGKAIYTVRGGSYTDLSDGLRCDFESTALVEDAFSANVGFRCCSRCGNGVLDPGEGCDDGNLTNGDGCSAACGADTCGDGVVQGIEDCDCGTNPSSLPAGCVAVNGASTANCAVNCTRPAERCSALYPGDQDAGGEATDCADPDCAGTWCGDVTDDDGDGFAEADGDCNDADPNVHPAADELCDNGVDDNCNGYVDNAEPDKDGDGELRCVSNAVNDCDDWDPERSPAHIEICGDGIDNDCDGQVDINCATECEIAAFERSYIGCEYWPTSTANSQLDDAFDSNFGVVVFNDNQSAATVRIYRGGTQVASQTVSANASHTFELAYDSDLKGTYFSEQTVLKANGAYRLTSTLPVTVYQFNPLDYQINQPCVSDPSEDPCFSYTNDAALLLPTHVLDDHYYVTARAGWGLRRQWNDPFCGSSWMYNYPGFDWEYRGKHSMLAIVGTQNNTSVTVTFSANTHGGDEAQRNAGDTHTYSVDRGEVLQFASRMLTSGTACPGSTTSSVAFDDGSGCVLTDTLCDMGAAYDFTGTEVSANAPLAIYSGHNCAFVPYDTWACDHLEEQMFPTTTWGQSFVISRTEPQNMSSFPEEPNVVRVLSGKDNNVIEFSPSQPTVGSSVTLDSGQWVEFLTTDNFSINGTEALQVTQFLVGQDYYSDDPDTWHGDPGYALQVPVEQFRTSYSFLVPSTMTYHWLNIVKPVAQPGLNAPTVYLDGVAIPETNFSPAIGDSYYGVARLDISSAPYAHVIESNQPFGIMVYGFARYTSYFYPGGLDLNLINSVN